MNCFDLSIHLTRKGFQAGFPFLFLLNGLSGTLNFSYRIPYTLFCVTEVFLLTLRFWFIFKFLLFWGVGVIDKCESVTRKSFISTARSVVILSGCVTVSLSKFHCHKGGTAEIMLLKYVTLLYVKPYATMFLE
jgi:hypothetical protein